MRGDSGDEDRTHETERTQSAREIESARDREIETQTSRRETHALRSQLAQSELIDIDSIPVCSRVSGQPHRLQVGTLSMMVPTIGSVPGALL
jgi:hypothetical protein